MVRDTELDRDNNVDKDNNSRILPRCVQAKHSMSLEEYEEQVPNPVVTIGESRRSNSASHSRTSSLTGSHSRTSSLTGGHGHTSSLLCSQNRSSSLTGSYSRTSSLPGSNSRTSSLTGSHVVHLASQVVTVVVIPLHSTFHIVLVLLL